MNMKTIVVYQSSTGFTKQYAEWIASDLQCKSYNLKEVTSSEIANADQVIFGGWVFGGMVNGLDKFLQLNPKKYIVFAVGSSPEEVIDKEAMKTQNHLENIPFFYMIGGLKWDKLNFMVKGMLKMMKKSLMKKADKTPQEQVMVERLGTSFDESDRKYIEPLVQYAESAS